MRMLIGATVLVDSCNRIPYVTAFHGNFGLMPPEKRNNDGFDWSVFLMSTDPRIHLFLLIILAVSAALMSVGWHARTATFLCWVLHTSACNHNLELLQGGDRLCIGILFWCMFLPIDEVWSIDRFLYEFDKKEKSYSQKARQEQASSRERTSEKGQTPSASEEKSTRSDSMAPRQSGSAPVTTDTWVQPNKQMFLGAASFGLTALMCTLYLCNAIHKSDPSALPCCCVVLHFQTLVVD